MPPCSQQPIYSIQTGTLYTFSGPTVGLETVCNISPGIRSKLRGEYCLIDVSPQQSPDYLRDTLDAVLNATSESERSIAVIVVLLTDADEAVRRERARALYGSQMTCDNETRGRQRSQNRENDKVAHLIQNQILVLSHFWSRITLL